MSQETNPLSPERRAAYAMVLGVSENADEDEVKSAFYKIALKDHPDKNPGDAAAEERFKFASDAYTALTQKQVPSMDEILSAEKIFGEDAKSKALFRIKRERTLRELDKEFKKRNE